MFDHESAFLRMMLDRVGAGHLREAPGALGDKVPAKRGLETRINPGLEPGRQIGGFLYHGVSGSDAHGRVGKLPRGGTRIAAIYGSVERVIHRLQIIQ